MYQVMPHLPSTIWNHMHTESYTMPSTPCVWPFRLTLAHPREGQPGLLHLQGTHGSTTTVNGTQSWHPGLPRSETATTTFHRESKGTNVFI